MRRIINSPWIRLMNKRVLRLLIISQRWLVHLEIDREDLYNILREKE